jgi:hypothetical protein
VDTRLLLTALLGACLSAPPAAAQEAPPARQAASAQPKAPTVSGVIVTAPKSLSQEPKLRSKLETFVRTYGAPAPLGQLARWEEKVCPSVSGFSAQENEAVAARIKALAVEAGAPTADGPQCRRTVSVFFADQPQQVLDAIRSRAPVFLGYHYPAQTRRIATFTGTVKAWYTTATRGAGGEQRIDDTRYRLPPGDPSSRLTTGVASEFAGVVIIADASKLRGYDIGAVADYVAMLALSQTGAQTGCQPLPTIMNLFAGDCAASHADRVTGVDLAYLRALYTTDPRLPLELQQAELVAKMEHKLRP